MYIMHACLPVFLGPRGRSPKLGAIVTLTWFCRHHPRLSPLGNNLGTALRGFPQHVSLFATRRAPGGAVAEPQTQADVTWKVKGKFDGVSYSGGLAHELDD